MNSGISWGAGSWGNGSTISEDGNVIHNNFCRQFNDYITLLILTQIMHDSAHTDGTILTMALVVKKIL